MYQGLISNLFRIASGAGFCSSTRRDPPPRSYVMMIDIPRRTVAVNAYFGWCRIECVLPRSKYHFLLSRLQPGYYPVYKQLDINLIFRIIPPVIMSLLIVYTTDGNGINFEFAKMKLLYH